MGHPFFVATALWTLGMKFLAEAAISTDPTTGLLFPLLSQGPVAAILAWMLYQQAQDKKNEAVMRHEANMAMVRLAQSVQKQAKSVLVLSLKLDPKNSNEVKELLREFGEQGDQE